METLLITVFIVAFGACFVVVRHSETSLLSAVISIIFALLYVVVVFILWELWTRLGFTSPGF